MSLGPTKQIVTGNPAQNRPQVTVTQVKHFAKGLTVIELDSSPGIVKETSDDEEPTQE